MRYGHGYDHFWADEENEEQVGHGGGLADRAVRGNNESTEDSDHEDEDEDEDGGNEDEKDEGEGEGDEENNGGYWDVTFHGDPDAACCGGAAPLRKL
eukprot:jgi/Tetstr1/465720/TSEL_010345.t1